jgi:hypothetical protein
LEFAIYLEGNSNIIRSNLVTMNYWATVFVPWEAPFDVTYWGAIDAHMADSIVLEDNFVAGAQRSGILFKGGLCPGASIGVGMNHSIKNNIVHSSLAGVSVYPSYTYSQLDCVLMSTFTVFKSVNWGIYYQNPQAVIFDSNVLVDNRVGVLALVIEPNEVTHEPTSKTVKIRNSIFIGRSSSFNCTTDVSPTDFNSKWALSIRAFGAGPEPNESGMIGLVSGCFLGAQNKMPKKPWFV